MAASSQYYSVSARVGVPSRHEVEVTIPLVGPAGPAGEAGAGAVESVNGQTGVVVLAAANVGAAATSHAHGNLSNAGAIGTTANLPVKTGTSGVLEAGAFGTSAGQFAEGNHTHTPASLGAAQAVTDIELTQNGTTTITTAQLPARGIAFTDGAMNFTVNLPTPNIRQSGLAFSIKREIEGGTGGDSFVTVVHNSVNLLTSYELDEAEGSIDFLWDGYEWTYSSLFFLRSKPSRLVTLPASTGTLAINPMTSTGDLFVGGTSGAPARLALGTASQQLRVNSGATALEYFTPAAAFDPASPGAIGSTTPAAGTFTTLTANTSLTLGTSGILTGGTNLIEQVNSTNAQTFRIYRTFTDASNYDRGFTRWNGATLEIGVERLGSAGSPDLHLLRGGAAWVQLVSSGMQVGTVLRVTNGSAVALNGGNLQFLTSTGQLQVILDRDDFNIFAQRNGTNAQEYRVYGTYTSLTNFQRLTIKTKAVTLSALSGASVATTGGFIPDGAVLVGLTTRVSTAITGATGYDIGDGSDADRWGANVAIALNTSSDNTNWTAGTIECFTAAQEVTLTAVGSNFTGGAVVIVAHYLAGEAD
jgi:hypothetical protein